MNETLKHWYEVAKTLKNSDSSHLIDNTIPEEFLEEIKKKLESKIIKPESTFIISNKNDKYWCDSKIRNNLYWSSYKNILINKKWSTKLSIQE